ncbi:hypothetical protein [Caballeronia ptereochthonis]|uniref:Histone H1-like nucleoprotein HC2 n=1 Tax=Caballeronia ptereochthonis TaxID=1777144 RepID=A0A158A723_9BURK|nr:hypothetical protein [Caballeronia ptereochthonis]SAK52897.1 hypothetical protein AWB83_01329 [Caballeronia ptereochthonis]
MNTPQVKAPTKKAFHFPKGADDKAQAPAKVEGKASRKTEAKAAATPKTKAKASATAKAPAAKAPAVEATAAKDAVKSPAKPDAKTKRVKKEKVVRDSFTMPKSDYAKIATLKQKCLNNGVRVKKSELLRAALSLLDAAPDKRLIAAIKALETVKTGRPANA